MPLSPELSARMAAVRSSLGGGDPSALGRLKAKLSKREAMGGYTQNVADLKVAISQMENDDDN